MATLEIKDCGIQTEIKIENEQSKREFCEDLACKLTEAEESTKN